MTSPPYWAISRMKRLLMNDQCRLAGQIHRADAADGVVGVGHLLLDLEVAAGAQSLHDEAAATSRAASTARPANATTLTDGM